MKVIKKLGRYFLLLAVVAVVFSTPPRKATCAVKAVGVAGSEMTCCYFCDQRYEQCINGGGDPGGCENLRCSCMVGCGICPICP